MFSFRSDIAECICLYMERIIFPAFHSNQFALVIICIVFFKASCLLIFFFGHNSSRLSCGFATLFASLEFELYFGFFFCSWWRKHNRSSWKKQCIFVWGNGELEHSNNAQKGLCRNQARNVQRSYSNRRPACCELAPLTRYQKRLTKWCSYISCCDSNCPKG